MRKRTPEYVGSIGVMGEVKEEKGGREGSRKIYSYIKIKKNSYCSCKGPPVDLLPTSDFHTLMVCAYTHM